jgi:hypothetical protein
VEVLGPTAVYLPPVTSINAPVSSFDVVRALESVRLRAHIWDVPIDDGSRSSKDSHGIGPETLVCAGPPSHDEICDTRHARFAFRSRSPQKHQALPAHKGLVRQCDAKGS